MASTNRRNVFVLAWWIIGFFTVLLFYNNIFYTTHIYGSLDEQEPIESLTNIDRFTEKQMNSIESMQFDIDKVTKELNSMRNKWDVASSVFDSLRFAQSIENKTILFVGDSTIRVTIAYFANCVCLRSKTKFQSNNCKQDQLWIHALKQKQDTRAYPYLIRKTLTDRAVTHYHCDKYNANIIWMKEHAKSIPIIINTRITNGSNVTKLTEISTILNPNKVAEFELGPIRKWLNKVDILIYNLGLHLHQELRSSNPVDNQRKRGENINAIIAYEEHLDIISHKVWNSLKRSNKSCLFMQTSQSQNCNLMYGDRLCLFANHKNVSYFNVWYKDWNHYLLKCSQMMNIPVEICDNYYPGKLHIPLNERLTRYVKQKQINDDIQNMFIADIGLLTNDTDFCHYNDFIHKASCASAKVFYFLQLFHMAQC